MFSTAEIARIVEGRLLRGGDERPQRAIHDSRLVREGDLFVALSGARTDGHAFLAEAFARGACGAFVSDTAAIPASGRNIIVVEDTLCALQTLAAAWRQELHATNVTTTAAAGVPIFVGITGSYGKTTTKSLLLHLLKEGFNVFCAPRNYNTEIGLPLALLEMPADAQVGLFELDASGPGEIGPLAALLAPVIAIITAVGRAHLAGLGSVEAAAQENWDLVRSLPPEGRAIVNIDHPELARFVAGEKEQPVTTGTVTTGTVTTGTITSGAITIGAITIGATTGACRAALHGRVVDAHAGITVEVKTPPLHLETALLGRHNATNILAAVAVALELGVLPETIERRIKTFAPFPQRLNLLPAPFGHLLDDTYNANPDSTTAALRTLAELGLPVARRGFVFGDMLDLGADSACYHREVLNLALDLGIAPIFPVGERAEKAAREAEKDAPADTFILSPFDELACCIAKSLTGAPSILLIKGSRNLGLERLVERLTLGVPTPPPRDHGNHQERPAPF